MFLNKNALTGFLVILIVFSLISCFANNDVVGSCKTAALEDQSIICIDYLEAKNLEQWRTACNSVMQGQWSSHACNTSSALGGCEAGNKVIWMYPSTKHRNSQDVELSCAAKSRQFLPLPTQ